LKRELTFFPRVWYVIFFRWNWLFGWYIVEYEQRGEDRAKCGSYLIDELSKELTVKGTSPTNLREFREFYQAYPDIQQTVSVRSIYSENKILPVPNRSLPDF
jgi:hypothetical protein